MPEDLLPSALLDNVDVAADVDGDAKHLGSK